MSRFHDVGRAVGSILVHFPRRERLQTHRELPRTNQALIDFNTVEQWSPEQHVFSLRDRRVQGNPLIYSSLDSTSVRSLAKLFPYQY